MEMLNKFNFYRHLQPCSGWTIKPRTQLEKPWMAGYVLDAITGGSHVFLMVPNFRFTRNAEEICLVCVYNVGI